MKQIATEERIPSVRARPLPRGGLRQILVWLGVLLLVAFPLVSPGPFYVSFVTEIMIFALWAASLDLLAGYTGLTSFGHAGYFGLGAYGAALFMMHFVPDLFLGLVAGAVVAGIAAVVVGSLSVRLPGIAFSMLTLAFAQMFYTVAFKWRNITGGDDGLRSVPRPSFDLGPLTLDITERTHLYWLTLAILVLVAIVLRRIVQSPFGAVLEAIRENEERARFVGYNTRLYKFGAFVLAGTAAGVAGALFALLKGFLAPNVLHWGASGQVLMMAILGGLGTLFGPMLGAAVYMFAQELLSTYFEHWMLFLGALFVVMVLFARGGIVGLLRGWLSGGQA
jgi:branched-chain amino acid transport system permease protein